MNIPSAMLLCPDYLNRPVDARWQRVTDLADQRKPATHKWDDDWVRRGLRYERRRRACVSEQDRTRLARRDPDVHAAYQLRHGDDKLARGELEARVLAGQSADEVASRCGVGADVVAAYLRLFFDVEGRLGARLYIAVEALGPAMWDGTLRETDVDLMAKWIAFLKGPVLLDVMLRYLRGGLVVPASLEDLSAGQLEELALMVQMRGLVVAWGTPWPGCMRALRLCELAHQMRELALRKAGLAGQASPEPLRVAGIDASWWAAWCDEVEEAVA